MLLSAVSVLVVAQSSSEIPEGLMINPVHAFKLHFYGQFSHLPKPLTISHKEEYCCLLTSCKPICFVLKFRHAQNVWL